MATKTLTEAYQLALQVQDASNLSGVLISWERDIRPLVWEDVRANGGDFNTHPLNVLFASKVNSLTGYGQRFSEAYRIALEKVQNT